MINPTINYENIDLYLRVVEIQSDPIYPSELIRPKSSEYRHRSRQTRDTTLMSTIFKKGILPLRGIPRWSRNNRVAEDIFKQLARVPLLVPLWPHFTRKNQDCKGENSLETGNTRTQRLSALTSASIYNVRFIYTVPSAPHSGSRIPGERASFHLFYIRFQPFVLTK